MFLWKCLGTNSCSLRCCNFAVYKLQAFSNFTLDRLATSSPTSSDPQSISPTSEVRNCSFISVLAMMCLDIVLPFACRQYARSIHVRFVHHIHTTSTRHPHNKREAPRLAELRFTALGWYFDRVLPKEYGVRLSPNFIFRRSFWQSIWRLCSVKHAPFINYLFLF